MKTCDYTSYLSKFFTYVYVYAVLSHKHIGKMLLFYFAQRFPEDLNP